MQLFKCNLHSLNSYFRFTVFNDSDLNTHLIFLLILLIKTADDATEDSDIDWSNSRKDSDSDSQSINAEPEAKKKTRKYTKGPSDKGDNYL